MKDKTFRSDRVLSYFRAEWKVLLAVTGYAVTIVIVQSARYIKRFYVRRFANNVNHQEPGIFVSRFVGDVDTVLRPGLSVCLLMRAVSSVSWR